MTRTFLSIALIAFTFFGPTETWGQSQKKSLSIEAILNLKQVGDVEVSPDEKWAAYTVSSVDTTKDKSNTQIWMVSTSGGDPIPMTSKEYSASSPKWSPDGKYLSFMAQKGEKTKTQVWNLNRWGGEAQQVTKTKQGVTGYEWSPDGKRLLLVLKDPKPADLTKDTKDDEKPLPHVIDRIHFKQDYSGYLDRRRNHLYVYTPGDSTATQITSGDFDDREPAWSPDGKSIAFVSNRSNDPDLSYDDNIWIVSADNTDKGATLKQVTTNPLSEGSPSWSPDGKMITYTTTVNESAVPFATEHLAIISANGGKATLLTEEIDRNISKPKFSKDGKTILCILEDSGERQLASIATSGKGFTRMVKGKLTLRDYAIGNSSIYTLQSYGDKPADVYKLQNSQLTQLTKTNDALLNGIQLGTFEKVRFNSKDGTPIEGFTLKPDSFDPSKKYPLILWIHGGPQSQFSYNFENTTPFYFAANGYVVLMVNPRGSTGYGEDFCKAIYADWGNKDYDDVMAGVDYMIDQGFIDKEKLGVGGWSYGGILTNYIITKSDRFKAAISGASLGIIRANFGHDHYIKWYNKEFGMPWESKDLWERLSPFNEVEKIVTPTLWMGGAVDWNVPIVNSEQMYLAMKTLGRDTQLVVYPNEHHGIRRPSFIKDRLQRFVGWFDKYLK